MNKEQKDYHRLIHKLAELWVYKDRYSGVPITSCGELMRRVDQCLLRSDYRVATAICSTLARAGLPEKHVARYRRALQWRGKYLSIVHRVN